METVLGIIGGSGVYALEGLEDARWQSVETPWGAPSDQLLTGRLAGLGLVFLPRHGRGHVHTPSSVPYPANIAALKALGVTDVLAVSAVGSFREDMAPGDFVVVDQFVDRTVGRPSTFFGPGLAAHVSFAHPTCPRLSALATQAGRDAGATVREGGTYLAMEGPQFSTLAESRLYRDVWGCDVIGMTNLPEAKLAREAELCYASVAMVTDFDSWHPDHGEVDITDILRVAGSNADKARELVARMARSLDVERAACPHGCDRALEHAIMTAPERRDPAMVAKLRGVAGRVL